jgi:hypothetical protein
VWQAPGFAPGRRVAVSIRPHLIRLQAAATAPAGAGAGNRSARPRAPGRVSRRRGGVRGRGARHGPRAPGCRGRSRPRLAAGAAVALGIDPAASCRWRTTDRMGYASPSGEGPPMHFGLFVRGSATRPTRRLRRSGRPWQHADAAEPSGSTACGWARFTSIPPARSISAPLVMATAMATRTKRVHVGTAVQVLPLGNPLRIAEEAATLGPAERGPVSDGRRPQRRRAHLRRARHSLRREPGAGFKESLAILREAWKG